VVALESRDAARRQPLKLQLLLYPAVDRRGGYASLVENGEGYLLDTEMREWFAEMYVPDGVPADDWRLSPLCAASHADLAPAVVVTAEYDPLRDEGIAYVAALERAGVPVTHLHADGMIHGFLQYAPFHDGARSVMDDIGATLRRALA
jgi:acetyl esterase